MEKYVDLNNLSITEIPPTLVGFRGVEGVYLGYNKITDISPLAELKNLERLYLSGNQITDISALKELKNLEWLELSDNQITNISMLSKLANNGTTIIHNEI